MSRSFHRTTSGGRISRFVVLALTFLFVSSTLFAKDALKPIIIDCNAGQRLSDALLNPVSPLVVEFSGVCAENVVINRDAVELRGRTADALITGATGAVGPAAAVRVVAARSVTLRDFAVTTVEVRGIEIESSTKVVVDGVRLLNNVNHGLIILNGSEVLVRNSTFDDNGGFGLSAWTNCTVNLEGTIQMNRNRAGYVGSSSDLAISRSGAAITATDNRDGFALQLGATAFFSSGSGVTLTVHGGSEAVSVILGSTWSASQLTITGASWGVLVSESMFNQNSMTVTNCDVGVWIEESAEAQIYMATVSGNSIGLLVDAATAWIGDATLQTNGVDADLRFGSRVTFDGASTSGSTQCESSVLVRGVVLCPPAAAKTAARGTRVNRPTLHPQELESVD